MNTLLPICFSIVALVIAAWLVWRFASRRHALPALLVTVLGEIPDREAALREAFAALKPGGILSVTEIVFDPHFQSRETVLRLAGAAGFREKAFFGNRIAFTLNLEKPRGSQALAQTALAVARPNPTAGSFL